MIFKFCLFTYSIHAYLHNKVILNKLTHCHVYLNFYTGTVALISLLTGSVVSRFYDPSLASAVLGANQTEEILHNMTIPDNAKDEPIEVELPDHVKINIAASICLLVGLAQVTFLISKVICFKSVLQ